MACPKLGPHASIRQDEIVHEAQTMKNYNHPNVLPLHCSFVEGQDLWMIMPFISGGSVLHIMKVGSRMGLLRGCMAPWRWAAAAGPAVRACGEGRAACRRSSV